MSLPVQLVRVPYNSGHRRARMDAGPDALAPAVAAGPITAYGPRCDPDRHALPLTATLAATITHADH